MLTLFEQITVEINSVEKEKILPIVITILEDKIGIENRITNAKMREQIEFQTGIKVHDSRLRKIIQYIRVNGLLDCVLGGGKGYWLAKDWHEVEQSVESQDQRINAQTVTRDSIYYQGKRKFNP